MPLLTCARDVTYGHRPRQWTITAVVCALLALPLSMETLTIGATHTRLAKTASAAAPTTSKTSRGQPLLPADIAGVHLLGQYASVSPSGRFVALMTCGPSARQQEYDDALWLSSGLSSRFHGCRLQIIERLSGALVFAPAGISVPGRWAHRRDLFAFAWERNGQATLYTWSAATRATRSVAALRVRIQDSSVEGLPLWLADDRRIVVKSVEAGGDRGLLEQIWFSRPVDRTQQPRERALTARAGAITRDETEVSAFAELFAGTLSVVDTKTGAVRHWLDGVNALHAAVSPDGRLLAVQHFVGRSALAEGYWTFDVLLVDTQTGTRTVQQRMVGKGSGWGHRFSSWSPSGTYLAIGDCRLLRRDGALLTLEAPKGGRECGQAWAADDDVLYNLHEDGAIGRWTLDAYTLPTTTPRTVASGNGRDAGLLLNGRRDRLFIGVDGTLGITAILPDAGLNVILKVDPRTGRVQELRRAEEHWGTPHPNFVARDFTPDRRTVVSEVATRARPRELASLDWTTGDVTPLTTLNPRFRARRPPPGLSYTWRANGATGPVMNGWLYLAPGASPRRKSPVVVWVYGGRGLALDHNRFGVDSYFNVNLFLEHGVSVFVSDSGQSDGNPRVSIASPVARGIDVMSRHAAVDPERIAVAGFSFGAYTALSLATIDPRIKTTVAICGIYDPWSLYWTLTRLGTTPYLRFLNLDQAFKLGPALDNPARYLENSILTHAGRIKGSVLLIHGGHDTIPESQPASVFAALRAQGGDATFVVYEKGRHGFEHSADHEPSLARILEWLTQEL